MWLLWLLGLHGVICLGFFLGCAADGHGWSAARAKWCLWTSNNLPRYSTETGSLEAATSEEEKDMEDHQSLSDMALDITTIPQRVLITWILMTDIPRLGEV